MARFIRLKRTDGKAVLVNTGLIREVTLESWPDGTETVTVEFTDGTTREYTKGSSLRLAEELTSGRSDRTAEALNRIWEVLRARLR